MKEVSKKTFWKHIQEFADLKLDVDPHEYEDHYGHGWMIDYHIDMEYRIY
ncbi:MAG: hypothetical protein PUF37_01070 [Prevotellaceae bacterium]|nr:hypothetical protein [Prevotellaceae bacterium]